VGTAGDPFRHELVVRWADCDPAGRVYYPVYFTYFECAIAEFLGLRGCDWNTMRAGHGLTTPRLEVRCRYAASARYNDRLAVLVGRRELRARVAILGFRVQRCAGGELLAEGEVRFAVVPVEPPPGQRLRAVPLPDVLRGALEDLPVWSDPV
jgi:acyl-CoA thioester hydrolase